MLTVYRSVLSRPGAIWFSAAGLVGRLPLSMAGLGMLGPASRAPLGKMTKSAVAMCRDGLAELHSRSPEILAPPQARNQR